MSMSRRFSARFNRGRAGRTGSVVAPNNGPSSPAWVTDANVRNVWIADDTYTGGGATLTTWTPVKGTDNITVVGSPTISAGMGSGNYKYVHTDGTTSLLKCDALATLVSGNDLPFTLCIMYRLGATAINKWVWAFADTSDSARAMDFGPSTGNLWTCSRFDNSASVTVQVGTLPVDTQWHCMTVVFYGTYVSIYVDGALSNINGTPMDVASFVLSKFTIGGYRGAGTFFGNAMDIRAVGFGPAAWSDNTRISLEDQFLAYANSTAQKAIRGTPSKVTPTEAAFSVSDEQAVIGSLGVGWWYDYNPSTTVSVAGASYAPMIYDRSYLSQLSTAATYGTILGYNEPDLAGGANVSVSQALIDWPSFEATLARLGSPACATPMDGTPGAWFTLFMNGNGGGYLPHVDFICVHIYQDPTGNAFAKALNTLSYLDAVRTAWVKPVRLTESNGITFSGSYPSWTYATQQWSKEYQRTIMMGARTRSWLEGVAFYPMAYDSVILNNAPNAAGIVHANLNKSLTTSGLSYATIWG